MKKVIKVSGMTCEHCKARVEKALSSVDGVKSAKVDLKKPRPPSPSRRTSRTTFWKKPSSTRDTKRAR